MFSRLTWMFVTFLMVMAGCMDPPGAGATRGRHPHLAPDIYVRVVPASGAATAWVLERVHGNPFVSGTVRLYAAPGETLGPHQLGALPMRGRAFTLWPGLPLPRSPHATSRHASIPAPGGPWRGLVAELRPEHRYLAAVAFPLVPQSPGPRIITASLHYCHRPDLLACVTWGRAVERGHVRCETRRGRVLRKSECRNYVPDTHWYVDGVQLKAWEE